MKNICTIGSRIAILGRLYAKRLNEQIVSTGLTGSQWAIIKCLLIDDALTQTSICDQLSVEAPTISKTLVAMENAGWIKRIVDENDKREKKVVLTNKAKEHIDTWTKIAGTINLEALVDVSEQDISTLDRILDQILINLKSS